MSETTPGETPVERRLREMADTLGDGAWAQQAQLLRDAADALTAAHAARDAALRERDEARAARAKRLTP
jgi:hypothetical protein